MDMLRMAGVDFGLAQHVEVGWRVRHYGTKAWGVVLEVVPQQDRTAELKVQPDEPFMPGSKNEPSWWATYHVDQVERPADGPCCADGRPHEGYTHLGITFREGNRWGKSPAPGWDCWNHEECHGRTYRRGWTAPGAPATIKP